MKTFKFIATIAVGLFMLVSPQLASAQDATSQAFCRNIETIGGNMVSSMEAKRQDRPLVNFDSQVQAANQKLSKARLEADRARIRHFELIIIRVDDPAQKAAIQNYRDAVTQIINTRRNRVDLAQSEFVTKLTELVNEHRQAVANNEAEFMSNIKRSIEDTKQSCTSDSQTQAVRLRFVNELRLVKNDFNLKKQSLARHSLEYRQLVAGRNTAISQATDTYRQAEQQAKQQFLSDIQLGR